MREPKKRMFTNVTVTHDSKRLYKALNNVTLVLLMYGSYQLKIPTNMATEDFCRTCQKILQLYPGGLIHS